MALKQHQHDTMLSNDSSRRPTGFSVILKKLREDPKIFLDSAYHSLGRLLTYDDKLPIEHGLYALNPFEVELFRTLEGAEHLKLTSSHDFSFSGYAGQIFYNDFGRLHIRLEEEPFPNYGQEVKIDHIGYLDIPQDIFEIAQKKNQAELLKESYLRSELDSFLQAKESAGKLKDVLDLIDDVVRHIDNVYIYIQDELFSLVMDGYTNLIDTTKKPGFFSGLREKPLKDWTNEQRLGIAGFWCLFLSGGASRFEEFNGKQMTATRIYVRLQQLLEDYLNHGGTLDTPIDLKSQIGLFELAKIVGDVAKQSIEKEWLRSRWINGLTWFKTEKVLFTPKSSEVDKAIPESIANLYKSWTGKSFNYDLGYEQIFSELADMAISGNVVGNEETPAKQPIELLIQEIVTASVLATQSDYGMSSSMRNPSLLIDENYENCLSTMMSLKPKDFYCCVVSRTGLSQQMGAVISDHIYRAVQARMEYNRWHFIPGNFVKTDVPRNRHYFYPPAMPDLAEWSDQHHPGHLLASVRYTIRSPGPDLNQPPLLIGGRYYRGFYDIRVVRMGSVPYDVQDMLVVRHHCLWMGVVWKRIVSHCEKNHGSVKIIGFEKGQGYEP